MMRAGVGAKARMNGRCPAHRAIPVLAIPKVATESHSLARFAASRVAWGHKPR